MKTLVFRMLRLALSMTPVIGATGANATMRAPSDPWQVAQGEDTAHAYTRFIVENPGSDHVQEATLRIARVGAPKPEPAVLRVAPEPEGRGPAQMGQFHGASRLMNI